MARTGAAEAGTAQIGSAIGIWRAMGSDVALPAFLSILAEAQIANGHATAAMETTDEALALIARNGERQWASVVRCVRGDIFNVTRNAVRAEAEYETGLSIARLQGGRAWALRAALGFARLWRVQDKRNRHELPHRQQSAGRVCSGSASSTGAGPRQPLECRGGHLRGCRAHHLSAAVVRAADGSDRRNSASGWAGTDRDGDCWRPATAPTPIS
jgi:hypothetical protein